MLLIYILVFITLLVVYFWKTFTYWDNKNVVSVPSPSPIKGNMHTSIAATITEMYKYFKNKGLKYGGFYFFHQPVFMPLDPELIKQIMSKDFEYFTGKGLYTNEKHQPIGMHLFNIGGERWKKLRVKLTPTFTSGKLKNMFPTIVACTKPLVGEIEELSKASIDIDIKDVSSKFTTDVIGSCAFGIECNSFKNSKSEFHHFGKEIMTVTNTTLIKRAMSMSFPKLCRYFGLVLLSNDIEQFYNNIVTENIKYRQEKHVQRNDFLQLLMELLNKEQATDRITIQEIVNQSFIFYLAGYETSSSVMSFALLELSQNVAMQNKVREEIQEVLKRHNGEITYEAMFEMKYLGQVIDETMRMYPPVLILNRECTKDYKIPGSDVVLDAGTKVFIPVLPLQHDEEYYPEAERFDPERFSDENKKTRHPYAFLPFGEGPRQCIGLRFGLIQTKIGLVTLLRKFKFAMHPSVKYPIQFGNAFLALNTNEPVLLTSSII